MKSDLKLEQEAFDAFCSDSRGDFISGYIKGYRKAEPVWHDLIKNPNDFPIPTNVKDYPGNQMRFAPKYLVKTKNDIKIARRIVYADGLVIWKSIAQNSKENLNVIAWMEIPQ